MPPSSTTGGGPTLEVIHENAGLRCFVRLKKSGVVVSPSPKLKTTQTVNLKQHFHSTLKQTRNASKMINPSQSVRHRSYFTHSATPPPSASLSWSIGGEPALVAISRNAGLRCFMRLRKPGVVVSPSPQVKQQHRNLFYCVPP